jgi:hypothetical protein
MKEVAEAILLAHEMEFSMSSSLDEEDQADGQ